MPTYTAILHTLYKGGVTGDGGSESHGSHPSPVVTAVMELVKSVLYAGDDTSCAALLADGSPLSCRCGPAVVAESLARLHARGQACALTARRPGQLTEAFRASLQACPCIIHLEIVWESCLDTPVLSAGCRGLPGRALYPMCDVL